MSKFQDWCKEALSVVQAAANGEIVQCSADNGHTWYDLDDCDSSDPALHLDFGDYDYRIRPRTIRIGGYDVPEPMRIHPEKGVAYFVPSISGGAYKFKFIGDQSDKMYLLNGVAHLDEDSALIHGKALISLTSMEK